MARVTLSNNITLNCKVDGPEGSPWLVMSNSLGADLSMWDNQISMLTAKYRVLRYDARGHGESDAPTGPYSFDDLLEDVIVLLDHHKIKTADWIGISKGAMTGMGLAIKHPERFGRMVLANARAVATDEYKAMWDQRIEAVTSGGMEAIADGSLGLWFTEGWRAANPKATAVARMMILGTDPQGYIASCQALRDLDYLKDLGSVSLPVLYVCGSEDKGAPPEDMQVVAKVTPGSTYVKIEGAAHIANINQADAFNMTISKFLSL